MTYVIGIGNQVGGVGKTTTTATMAYILCERKNRVLMIDADGQKDLTKLMEMSFGHYQYEAPRNIYQAFEDGSLNDAITQVDDDLDLVRGSAVVSALGEASDSMPRDERNKMLDGMLDEIKDDYDFVLIDMPPAAVTVLSGNIINASDYILMPAQTAGKDVANSVEFVKKLKDNQDEFGARVELAGVLPYFWQTDDEDDIAQLANLKREMPGAVLNSIIYRRKRVKKFFNGGLTDDKFSRWDHDWKKMYGDALDEMLERIKEFEGEK